MIYSPDRDTEYLDVVVVLGSLSGKPFKISRSNHISQQQDIIYRSDINKRLKNA